MKRIAFIALLAVGGIGQAALAQAPAAPDSSKAASKKARAAALGSPKEDDEPAPTTSRKGKRPEAAPLGTVDAEIALGRALLYAVEPAPQEIRVQAVEDLGLLGDGRALNLLAQLIFDANPAIQLSALKTITHFQAPRAEEILANVVRHPQVAELLKVRALEGLVFQRSPTSKEFLEEVARQPRYNYKLQSTARLALQDWSGAQAGAQR